MSAAVRDGAVDAGPLVVDTDVGGDPDDTVALVVAARWVPALALVITCDERGGERARLARHLLDLAGRPDVTVVAGRDLDPDALFVADGLVPGSVPAQPGDVRAAVARVCAAGTGPVRWLGLGPLTHLADLLTEAPELAGRLRVVQMGGALRYRAPQRGQHNVRRDVRAAAGALAALARHPPRLVLSDTTTTDAIGIPAGGVIHRGLADPGAPGWAGLVAAHLERWYAVAHPSTRQHDGLTLSAMLGLPYVRFTGTRVALDRAGRMSRDPAGHPVRISDGADHTGFMRWLAAALRWATPASARP